MFVIAAEVGRANAQSRRSGRAPHRELEDAQLGVRLEAAEGQRDAELRVVARLEATGAVRRAERSKDVLRRRLAG